MITLIVFLSASKLLPRFHFLSLPYILARICNNSVAVFLFSIFFRTDFYTDLAAKMRYHHKEQRNQCFFFFLSLTIDRTLSRTGFSCVILWRRRVVFLSLHFLIFAVLSLFSRIFCTRSTLPSKCSSFHHFKGTVQRDRFGWKWYQSIDLSLNVRRRDFQLILTAHSRVRGPLNFRATSYEYLQLLRQFPIRVQTFCSALFLTPFCYSQLR